LACLHLSTLAFPIAREWETAVFPDRAFKGKAHPQAARGEFKYLNQNADEHFQNR
jgi:hypothetical protein